MTSAARGRRWRLFGKPKTEREEPELVLEALRHVQVLLTDVNIPYAGALVYLPDVAAGPLWNVNYTDFLLGMNSSPRLCPLPPSPLPQGDRRTRTQTPETRGSAAGRRNSGPVHFYCYLPKRANYIWSLMWNLFCRLSVNKLCGSSQAAYLTFSGPFPHTSSSIFTRAGSCGEVTAAATPESLQQARQTPLASPSGPFPPSEAPPPPSEAPPRLSEAPPLPLKPPPSP